jgi:hypothetical protein
MARTVEVQEDGVGKQERQRKNDTRMSQPDPSRGLGMG